MQSLGRRKRECTRSGLPGSVIGFGGWSWVDICVDQRWLLSGLEGSVQVCGVLGKLLNEEAG